MTREEARKAAEVMLAYAEGKEIQFMVPTEGQGWKDFKEGETPKFSFNSFNYRIKPKFTYRPFKSREECWNEMMKHQPFGWVSYSSRFINIVNIDNTGIAYLYNSANDILGYVASFKYMKFADGTPFGIKEK